MPGSSSQLEPDRRTAEEGRGRPLEGLVVLALEQAVAAPYCTMKLADAGARVIKVERSRGDSARGFDRAVDGLSSYFAWLNRRKESVVLDIKSEDDAALLHRIAARADVVIQNLAPGAADRAGLGSADLRRRLPSLITVDITGYGRGSRHENRKAYDLLIQAETGLAGITGRPEGPGRVGVSVCDLTCGLNAYTAVLEALLHRDRNGRGCALQVSLFDCTAEWMAVPLLFRERAGRTPSRLGLHHPSIHPYGAYPVRGGEVVIAVQNDDEFERLCRHVLGRPELAHDPRFVDNPSRCENREALDEILTDRLAHLDPAELVDGLETAAIAYGEVHDLDGLSNHEALARITVDSEVGDVSLPAPPTRPEWRGAQLGRVPSLGEHTESLRAEFRGD